MKTTLFTISLLALAFNCLSQEREWSMKNGEADLQCVISIPGKNANELYTSTRRWIERQSISVDDISRVRFGDEYIECMVYHPNIYRHRALNAQDFKFRFVIEVKDEKVRTTLSRGSVVYDDLQETNNPIPIERYFSRLTERKDVHAERLIKAINARSEDLVNALKNALLNEDHSKGAW